MDQTRDLSGRETYRLSQLFDLPTFVKEADVGALCGPQDLPLECYAEPMRRLYPCHTPAATWMSTAFFLDKKASHRPADAESIQERLNYYAKYHGIGNSIKSLWEKAASLANPQELIYTDDDFGLVYEERGQKVRRYPLRNSGEVKAAATYLQEHRDSFPYKLRREFADRIMQKAAEHGTDIHEHNDYLERQAGYGACSSKVACEFLRDRVRASRNGAGSLNDTQNEMLNLAQLIEAQPSRLHSPGMLVKLAEVVDEFDRSTRLYRDYGPDLQRVEDVLFELTQEKMASAVKDHCSTITGNIYKLADIEQLPLASVRTYLGDDFAETVRRGNQVDVEKMAEVVPTLDRELAGLFDDLMAQANKAPIAKEAGAAVGFSRQYLVDMAMSYKHAHLTGQT